MDFIKDISDMMPRLNVIRLRMAVLSTSTEDLMKSWQSVKNGEDFYKTPLGRAYRRVKL